MYWKAHGCTGWRMMSTGGGTLLTMHLSPGIQVMIYSKNHIIHELDISEVIRLT